MRLSSDKGRATARKIAEGKKAEVNIAGAYSAAQPNPGKDVDRVAL
ncbi:MAG TPA: hypothetical protein VK138_00640 [Acidiferrobacterales bacterium]|nr:hypothetical protein [Acidiferrobacterales bacterium]